MSRQLLGEVALESNDEWLKQVWYFKDCSQDFIVELSIVLKAAVYAPRVLEISLLFDAI